MGDLVAPTLVTDVEKRSFSRRPDDEIAWRAFRHHHFEVRHNFVIHLLERDFGQFGVGRARDVLLKRVVVTPEIVLL